MTPTKLDNLVAQWELDAKVDTTEPGKEIIRIPNLHAKYSREMVSHSMAAKGRRFEYDALRKVKYEYYSGKMDHTELTKRGWEPFRFVLKGDITTYLEADPDLLKIKAYIVTHEEAISLCGMIMKELSNRTWQIKEYMAWEKFIAGQG